jgi:hypothetical protein
MYTAHTMRTRTTTREQTWNIQKNGGLTRFLYEQGWRDLVDKMKTLQSTKVVTDARELTTDPERVEIISAYIKNHGNRDLCE